MRKSRFTEEQIVSVLKEAEAGQKVDVLCRKHGISEHTFYRWKAKYGGVAPDDGEPVGVRAGGLLHRAGDWFTEGFATRDLKNLKEAKARPDELAA